MSEAKKRAEAKKIQAELTKNVSSMAEWTALTKKAYQSSMGRPMTESEFRSMASKMPQTKKIKQLEAQMKKLGITGAPSSKAQAAAGAAMASEEIAKRKAGGGTKGKKK